MRKRMIGALLLICILTGLLSAGTLAYAASMTVYVSNNLLKVYQSPSTSSACLGTMSYGESLIGVAASGDWAMVQNPAGATGYCLLSGLSPTDPNNLNLPAYIVVPNAPIYRKPSINSDVMMYLDYGSCYTCVAATPDGTWIRLQNGKYFGYLPRDYAAHSMPASPAVDPSVDPRQALGTAYVAANIAAIYSSNSLSSSISGAASYGESLLLFGYDDSWAYIQSADAVGFCQISDLTPSDPNTLSTRVTVTASSLNVRTHPSTSAPSLGKLKKGASCVCVAVTPDGAWARLQNGSMYGYASTAYLSGLNTYIDSEVTAYVVDTLVPVRANPSDSAVICAEVGFGTALPAVGAEGDWVAVSDSYGNIGFCKIDSLSLIDTNVYSEYAYALWDGVPIRALPRMDADVLQNLNVNNAVFCVSFSSDGAWARVRYGSEFGYVSTADLSPVEIDDGSDIVDIVPQIGYASATALICYAEPNLSSGQVAVLSYGQSVTVTGAGESWARLSDSSGDTAYCKLSGLTPDDPNTYNITLYAQHDDAPIYEGASTSAAPVIAKAPLNAAVTAIAVTPDMQWARVTVNGIDFGYVIRSDFDVTPVSDPQPDSKLEAVIALAEAQMNKPYVYGAEGTDSYDCSGLTYYAFKNAAGISLQRTAYQQGYDDKYAKISSISSLQRGDLVFFNTVDTDDDLCDHVGIYLGDYQFIHASSGAAKVTVSALPANDSGSYYTRTFSWGRRIVK